MALPDRPHPQLAHVASAEGIGVKSPGTTLSTAEAIGTAQGTIRITTEARDVTPDELFDGYYRLQNAVHTVPAITRRFWGCKSKINFWLPMNYGFRRSIRKLTDRSKGFRAPSRLAGWERSPGLSGSV